MYVCIHMYMYICMRISRRSECENSIHSIHKVSRITGNAILILHNITLVVSSLLNRYRKRQRHVMITQELDKA